MNVAQVLVFILIKSKSSHDLGFPNFMDFRIIVLLCVWAYRTIMFLEFRVPNFSGSQSAKRVWFLSKSLKPFAKDYK